MKRFLMMGMVIMLVLGIGQAGGCEKDERLTDRVIVGIKEEYKDKFLAQEFTVADFDWDNIESIEYHAWYENNPEIGYLHVNLKKHGIRQIEDAAAHIRQLEFVSGVSFDSPIFEA